MNVHTPSILITIDLEDWFQVENLKPSISHSEWHAKEYRLERNTQRLLDLFDRFHVNATFFVLGWNAERAPGLVREIHMRGHEIASHGHNHRLSQEQTFAELRRDFFQSKAILEEIIAQPVLGYRAPSFSVSGPLLTLLKEADFLYDSSYNSFSLNVRHGSLDLPAIHRNKAAFQLSSSLWELPVSNLFLGKWALPWGGGAYFRLIPWFLFKRGIKNIATHKEAYVFYFHPWEIDAKQPKIEALPLFNKFRHYYGLKHCYRKLNSLLETFSTFRFLTCSQYLFELMNSRNLD